MVRPERAGRRHDEWADATHRAGTPSVMTESTDADLVAQLQRGDHLALNALVRRWEGFVLRVAARVTGDVAEAEEVRQTLFLRLLQSPGNVREPDRFAAWLRRRYRSPRAANPGPEPCCGSTPAGRR